MRTKTIMRVRFDVELYLLFQLILFLKAFSSTSLDIPDQTDQNVNVSSIFYYRRRNDLPYRVPPYR